jgi:hypothetical protein
MSRWGAALVWLVGLLLASAVLAAVALPRWTSLRTQDLVGTWQDASGRQLPDGTRGPDFSTAVPTGFIRFGNKLFIDPDGAVYVRRPSATIERWGRSFSLIACS